MLGLVLLVLAFLLGLALLSHRAADDALVRETPWGEFFDLGENRTQNWLGPVGAVAAYALVTQLLGYPVLLLVVAMGAWGYVLFRQRKPIFLPLLTGLAALSAFLLASLLGWFEPRTEADLSAWSGAVGRGVASGLEHLLGPLGAFALLALALAVTALLYADLDLQRSIDRAEEFFFRVRDGARETWAAFREGSEERKRLRTQILDERRKRREADMAAREKRRRDREPAVTVKAAPLPPIEPPPEPPRVERPERSPRQEPARQESARPEPPEAPRPIALNDLFAPPVEEDEVALVDDLVREHRGVPPSSTSDGGPALHIHGPVEEEAADLDRERAAVPLQPDAHAVPYTFPSIELLEAPDGSQHLDREEIEEHKQLLLDKLETYNIEITEIDAVVGPTVTRYELTPAPGVKISRITALEDDLAMALAAPGIRIIAPIPGKSAIGVEIPNRTRELVRLRSLLATAKFRDARAAGMALPIAIGKAIEGEVFLEDLTRMPHLLIAGATGSGKSVGLNTLITGLLYACHPADLKFVMIDPKKIELNAYGALVDHFLAMPEDAEEPIISDFGQAAGVLRSCEREMERRYDRLAAAGVRGIKEYNEKVARGKLRAEDGHRHLPYIVVVVDELADLMMTSGKEVEPPIARLAQMARAVGLHLVIATQRPSVDVITGLIKANFPSRVAYQVASRIDSRTIIDGGGAQQLVGNGDLLYMNGSRLTRLQGPFLSVEEVEAVTAFVGAQPGAGPYLLPPMEAPPEAREAPGDADDDGERDDLFEEAARIIVRSQQGSVSLLQRKLSVGYTRAARLVDQLEEAGVVGPFEGSKAREVLVRDEMELDALLSAGPQG